MATNLGGTLDDAAFNSLKTLGNNADQADQASNLALKNENLLKMQQILKENPAAVNGSEQLKQLQKNLNAEIQGTSIVVDENILGTQLKDLFKNQKFLGISFRQKNFDDFSKSLDNLIKKDNNVRTLIQKTIPVSQQSQVSRVLSKTLTQEQLIMFYAASKSKSASFKTITVYALGKTRGIPVDPMYVNLPPGAMRNVRQILGNETAGLLTKANKTPVDAAKIDLNQQLLNLTAKSERRNIILTVTGLAVAVAAVLIGIFVKPPYWNDSSETDGSQQPWVDFLNWMLENPLLIGGAMWTCCCCCVCLICVCCMVLITSSGGGKKDGNFI